MEQAIEAVERCGPGIQACMDYLMTDEGEGELFRSSLLVKRDRVVQTQPMEEDSAPSQMLVFSHDLSPHAMLCTRIVYDTKLFSMLWYKLLFTAGTKEGFLSMKT